MSEPTWKSQSEIAAELVAAHQAHPDLAQVNSPATNSRWRGLYEIIAGGLALLWGAVRYVYRQFFTRYADEATLDRLLDDFNLSVPVNATVEDKRRAVAEHRNQLRVGTSAWYEQLTLSRFPRVRTVKYLPGYRGANTADIVVTYDFAPTLFAQADYPLLDQIQAFFTTKANQVGTEDLRVRTPQGHYSSLTNDWWV